MSCTLSIPTLEPHEGTKKSLLSQSWPTDSSGGMPLRKRTGSSGSDQASTHVSDDESSVEDFGCSPSPRYRWAPACLVGATPSPLLLAPAWAGPVTDFFIDTVRPTISTARRERSMPFQAIDLPEWAQMTETELNELSDSEYDGDSEYEFADESSDESDGHTRHQSNDSADESVNVFADDSVGKDCLTEDCAEIIESGSGAKLMVLRQQSLCDVSAPSSQRWADLAESEDEDEEEELARASCEAHRPRGAKAATGLRWADLADAEEDFTQCSVAGRSDEASLQAVRWADLAGSDTESE